MSLVFGIFGCLKMDARLPNTPELALWYRRSFTDSLRVSVSVRRHASREGQR